MPRAGKYRHRVTVQRPVQGEPSASGERTTTWVDVGKAWVSVHETGSREVWRAQQNNPEISSVVQMRYRSDLTSDMRIQYGTRYLHLTGPPIEDERRTELTLNCVEQV